MTKKQILIAAFTAALILVVSVAGTVAMHTPGQWKDHPIRAGHLEGQIVQEYQEPQSVMPGDKISNVVNVQNTGNKELAVRIKPEAAWVENNQLNTDHIALEFNSTYWASGGDGFYYYKEGLPAGEKTKEPLCNSVKISEDAGNECVDGEIALDFNLECLQADNQAVQKNWMPKNRSALPKFADKNRSGSMMKATYKGQTDGFLLEVADGGKPFSVFDGIMPGRTATQEITVSNESKQPVEILLKAEYSDINNLSATQKAKAQTMLKDMMKMNITGGADAYDGAVLSDKLTTGISLGKFEPAQTSKIKMIMLFDELAESDYSNIGSLSSWIFLAKVDGTEQPVAQTEKTSAGAIPKTGDNPMFYYMIIIAVISASILLLLIVQYRKKVRNEKDNL